MSDDGLKLTVYLGERARTEDGGCAADVLADIAARHGLRASVLLRGMEGFGANHRLRTDRLLTLSEDLPLVFAAVDARPRVEAALADVTALPFQGLVTLERVRLITESPGRVALLDVPGEAAKLTVYVGRHERAAGRPAHEVVVDVLHDAGVAGATVLLGVDGTLHGDRRRARLTGRNAEVPLMTVAVGTGAAIAAALGRLGDILERPLATLERVRLCKRDGLRIGEPRHVPGSDASGLGVWQKLTVFAGEQSRHAGAPLHAELVRELRRAGAAGATTLRGIRGYHGDHAPHGDTLWQLRRRVPVVTVVVDTPERTQEWFAIADACTDETGLVISELVPALHVAGPGSQRPSGGLPLAHLE